MGSTFSLEAFIIIIIIIIIIIYGHIHGKWKFPSQGLIPNLSCDLCSCMMYPLTHCARPGIEPMLLQQPNLLQSDY